MHTITDQCIHHCPSAANLEGSPHNQMRLVRHMSVCMMCDTLYKHQQIQYLHESYMY